MSSGKEGGVSQPADLAMSPFCVTFFKVSLCAFGPTCKTQKLVQLVNNARDAADLGGGGAAQAGGQGAAAAAQAATQREERRRAAEARRQEKQARDREAAAAASARATAFQQAASTGFSAPARASRGTTPWTRPGLGGALSR